MSLHIHPHAAECPRRQDAPGGRAEQARHLNRALTRIFCALFVGLLTLVLTLDCGLALAAYFGDAAFLSTWWILKVLALTTKAGGEQ